MTRKVEGSNAVVTTRTGVNTSGAQPPMQERDGSARRSFRPAGSIVLLASLAASFLATSSAPTPLYAVYGRDWHLTAANTSVVFGVYALSLLAGLLVLGRLSDHIGRRPTLGAAIATQIVAMAVFATAEGLSGLLVGRVLQGLSTGAGLAAVGAALLDVDSRRGTIANTVAPPAGSALGALAAAFAVQFLPAPTRVIYVLLAVVLIMQGLAVIRVRETAARKPGALASMRPELRLPPEVRRDFVAAAPVLFAVWALSGLLGSLGPALVHGLSGSGSVVYGVLPLTVIGIVSPVTAYLLRTARPRACLVLGIATLTVGVATIVVAVLLSSAPLLCGAAVVAGIGFGSGFRGGIQLVLPAVAPAERAGTLSLLYIVSYLGFGVPAILAGVIDQATGNLNATTLGYAAVLIVLALLAIAALRRSPRHQLRPPQKEDRHGARHEAAAA